MCVWGEGGWGEVAPKKVQQSFLKVCPFKYFGLITSIKAFWNTCRDSAIKNTVCESFSSKFKKSLLESRLVYSVFLSQKCTSTHSQHKWIMDALKKTI